MSQTAIGAIWALVAGVAFGTGQIANRGVNRRMSAIAASTAMLSAVLVALVIASAVIGDLGDLRSMPPAAAGWFVGATIIHFGIGWTLFVVSQQRLGISRTASILSTNPVVAALIAAAVISERLGPITWIGVVAVTIGVGLVARRGDAPATTRTVTDLAPILTTVLMFSISPLFVRAGLDVQPDARLGVIAGLAGTVPLMHLVTRAMTGAWVPLDPIALRWLLLGGSAAGLAITALWLAFDLIPVGATVSLQQTNTPVVLLLGPFVLREAHERPTVRMASGATLIVAGAVLVALFGTTPR